MDVLIAITESGAGIPGVWALSGQIGRKHVPLVTGAAGSGGGRDPVRPPSVEFQRSEGHTSFSGRREGKTVKVHLE